MNSKKQFCKRGHDTRSVGRMNSRTCKACNRDNSRLSLWKLAGITNPDGTLFTKLDYDRAYQVQQGKCLSCGIHQSELKARLCADHDHATSTFRFLLCDPCNRTLGSVRDNPTVLRRLADLLEGR